MEQAISIFNRLNEREKLQLRASTPARIEYLTDVEYRADMPLQEFDERVTVMREVQALCILEFTQKSAQTGFEGPTWKF